MILRTMPKTDTCQRKRLATHFHKPCQNEHKNRSFVRAVFSWIYRMVRYGQLHPEENKSRGGEVMEEKIYKCEIKIDPLDFHVGLKDKMDEFESLIRMNPGKKLAENVEKKLKSRFCHCCFFGHVEGEIMGEPLCKECAKNLHGFDADEEHPSIKKVDPYYQLWYRRRKALPIFEAYLHAELERFKLEQKIKEIE